MKTILKSENIFLEDRVISGSILVEDGKITDIKENGEIPGDEIIDFGKNKIFPGLIDIHVHGGNGHDTMNATYESINEISKFKLKEGVTSFCPTTVTAPDSKTDKAITNIYDAINKGVEGAKIIGTFLEGPFINPKFKGAHPEKYIQKVDKNKIMEMIKLGKGSIKSIAIAPELEGASDTIKALKELGINVRIGHSAATDKETFEAIEKGASIAIHTYNAMTPLNHRAPGMVGAVLVDDRIYNEVISDLVHVSETAMKVLVKCKKDKIILVTDCMEAGGLEDGDYKLGELDVIVKDSIARLKADGAIAGSTLSLMKAVENMYEKIGIPLLDVVNMASRTPAESLNIDSITGSIKIGKAADIISVDDDFNVKFVMVSGKVLL